MFLNFVDFSRYMQVMHYMQINHPNKMERFFTSISPQQIKSKEWLADILSDNQPYDYPIIDVVGSWFGWPLIDLLDSYDMSYCEIRLYDVDPLACEIANIYKMSSENRNVISIHNRDYWLNESSDAHVVINTSSEHMIGNHTQVKYHNNPIFAIQSSNKQIPEHINTVESSKEIEEQHGIKKVYFSGFKSLNNYEQRFMVIGHQQDIYVS